MSGQEQMRANQSYQPFNPFQRSTTSSFGAMSQAQTPGYVPGQTATTTTPQPSQPQSPGYVENAPAPVVEPPKPNPFIGGSAVFNENIKNRAGMNALPAAFQFNAPENVSLRSGFYTDLSGIQSQFLPPGAKVFADPSKLRGSQIARYNQQQSMLSRNQDYQNAVRSFLEREGLAGLLGA